MVEVAVVVVARRQGVPKLQKRVIALAAKQGGGPREGQRAVAVAAADTDHC